MHGLLVGAGDAPAGRAAPTRPCSRRRLEAQRRGLADCPALSTARGAAKRRQGGRTEEGRGDGALLAKILFKAISWVAGQALGDLGPPSMLAVAALQARQRRAGPACRRDGRLDRQRPRPDCGGDRLLMAAVAD